MSDGGKLTMGARTEKDRRLALTVEDTGVGISADKLDQHFRPVLHDQARRQRHRAVDRLQNRAAARRRDRSAVDRGAGNDVPAAPAAGVIIRRAESKGQRTENRRLRAESQLMKMRRAFVFGAALLAGACASSPARSSVKVPLEIPEPPPRVAMDPVPAVVAEAPAEPEPPPAMPPDKGGCAENAPCRVNRIAGSASGSVAAGHGGRGPAHNSPTGVATRRRSRKARQPRRKCASAWREPNRSSMQSLGTA